MTTAATRMGGAAGTAGTVGEREDGRQGVRDGAELIFRSASRIGVHKHGDAGEIRGRFAFERRAAAEHGGADGADGPAPWQDTEASEPVRLDGRKVDGSPTNATVCLTCWPAVNDKGFEASTVATRDPSDVAHAAQIHVGNVAMLSAVGRGAGTGRPGRARRYPRSQMTSRGVSIDSAYDGLHAAHGRLAREGMDVAGELGATRDGLSAVGAMFLRFREGGLDSNGVRAIFERNDGARLRDAEEVIAAYRSGAWSKDM